jgi:hypothetical protein
LISIAGAVGMYFYKGMVKTEIQGLEQQLAGAEGSIDKQTISEMSQFGQKLKIIKGVVVKHQVVSNFLTGLASSTVSSVYFSGFNYGDASDKNLTVVLNGKALNYASIALQEEVFSQNKYFKSVDFSDLTLAKGGLVSFEVKIVVDPKIAIYSPQ